MRAFCLGWVLALAGAAATAAAAEGPLCKSLCAGEKQACRKEVGHVVAFDRDEPLIAPEEKNPYARTASKNALQPHDVQVRDRASAESRRVERTAACDGAYARCVRACADDAATPSVLTKQGRDKRTAQPRE